MTSTLEGEVIGSPSSTSTKVKKTQIVVVGGGAGGLELAARLGKKFGRERHDIILLEKNATHIWKPLLHEVAAGSLDANLDEVGYRGHGFLCGYRFFLGTMQGIDRERREVIVAPLCDENGAEIMGEHHIRYDYLVVAVGSVANDFGVKGVKEHCLFLESRQEADRFRQKLLNQCLRVSRTMQRYPHADEFVRVAIVGGGATGVELSAELYNSAAELRHYGLEVFDESRLKVTLLEAGPRILPALPEDLAEAATEELRALGVDVRTNAQVEEVTPYGMKIKGGDLIPGDLKIWAAGVKAPDFLNGIAGLETTRNNQLVVLPTMQTTRDDRIYAIGDCAYYKPEGAERPIPPRAQSAHQMAEIVFKNICASLSGKPMKNFVYNDYGSLVSLSKFSTVGSLMGNLIGGRMAVEGRAARFMYVSLYRMHLIAIHGWLRGLFMIAIGHVNQVIRPKLKLH
ncbi:MAG: NAD(P)/FAD-dependent oxidoreductase [Parvularculaceae bacterium]|nr:NAD(P)/FAD-dependent oxidoreductase [Parvularculaceae bacterium]